MANGPKCSKCNDAKWSYEVDGEDLIPVPCVCLQREKLRRYIGNQDIWRVDHVKSPLLTDVRDATEENLFIKGTWDMMCKHLKWVLSAKYKYFPGFTFRITDDNQLLMVWLGEYAYKNQKQSDREGKVIWNGLDDFLEDPSLVVIKLGAVRRNKAAGDVLETALRIRARVAKPTWVVEDTEVYAPGHPAYSENASNYIFERFKTEDVGGDIDAARERKLDLEKMMNEFGTQHGVTMDKDETVDVLDAPRRSTKEDDDYEDDYERPDASPFDLAPPSNMGGKSKKKWKGR